MYNPDYVQGDDLGAEVKAIFYGDEIELRGRLRDLWWSNGTMTSVELPVRFDEPDEVLDTSDKGSSSGKGSTISDGPGTPHTNDSTGSPNSPSCSSTSSTSSAEDGYIMDTDVFLPTESVQSMAETVGVELDEESAAILSQTVVNKLRHLTLLAMQFSRHGRSKGLRVEDFKKAEKIVDSTASLGYGFSHKLPEYLDLGQVMVEWEGGDFDLSAITNKPAVDEITVDETAEPHLVSRCINYHDKISKDFDEGAQCPDFKDMFKNYSFSEKVPASTLGGYEYCAGQMNGGGSSLFGHRAGGFHSDCEDGAVRLSGSSVWNGDMKDSNEFYAVSVEECGDISISNLRTDLAKKAPGQSNQVMRVEKMILHSGAGECRGNDVTLASVHVPKKVKAEVEDGYGGLVPIDVTEEDGNQDSVVLKFEPGELGEVFHENVFIKEEKFGNEEAVVQLSIKQGSDFYKSGRFLYHQDMGDDIFSEETNDERAENDNSELNSRNNLHKENDDLQQSVQYQQTSKFSQEQKSNTSTTKINGTETEMEISDDSHISPPNEENVDLNHETTKETNCEDIGRESEDSEEDSEGSDEEQEIRGNPYDDDFEIIIEPDSPEIEVSDSDEDDNPSDDEEEKINAKLTGDVPVEWGYYLQNFIVAFYDKEKPYETFERVSFTFFPYEDEDEDDLPQLDNYQVLLKDIAQHGVFPVLHIICELFHNFVNGLYEHMGSKQLRRITAFVDTTLSCPVHSKTYHLKPMLAILMDMLVLPVPCKLQSYVTTSILKVADYSEHPFNIELVTWITRFIIGVLESSSKLSLAQLTPTVKSRICAAIYLALGYDLRGLRLQRMHQWVKYVIMISNNHYVTHQRPANGSLRIPCDSSDSYLEEAILRFIRVYMKHYHNDCPDESFKPILQRAIDNYGEKLSIQLCNYKYFDVSTNDLQPRVSRWQKKNTEECNNEEDNKIVNEFIMRPGWVQCKQLTKVKIPFAMCVL